jgi:hypothetical protein
MTFGKGASKTHHILLWIGASMIAAAIILALVGAFWLGRTANYASSPSSNAPSPGAEATIGTLGSSSSGAQAPSGVPSSLSEARTAFENAVSNFGNSNLEVKDVMEFANNYYAQVRESDTGIGAMELLIDKRSGRPYPEPGPNMMWNTKYGMMSGRGGMVGPDGQGMMGQGGPNGAGGMMGGFSQPTQVSPNDQLPITPDDATQIAKDYISRNSLGTDTETPEITSGSLWVE